MSKLNKKCGNLENCSRGQIERKQCLGEKNNKLKKCPM
jgi:hypothetical protein